MGENNSGFEMLNEMNYGQWKMLMKVLLVRKQLWDVVSGDETNPRENPNLRTMKNFWKHQAEASTEMILHAEVVQLLFISDKDLKVIWDYLKSIHQAHSMATCPTLHCQFFQLYKPDGPMQTFIAEVQHMAFQLKKIACEVSRHHFGSYQRTFPIIQKLHYRT